MSTTCILQDFRLCGPTAREIDKANDDLQKRLRQVQDQERKEKEHQEKLAKEQQQREELQRKEKIRKAYDEFIHPLLTDSQYGSVELKKCITKALEVRTLLSSFLYNVEALW